MRLSRRPPSAQLNNLSADLATLPPDPPVSAAPVAEPPVQPMPAAPETPPLLHATRGQRIALGLGLAVAAWLVLQLFAGVLAPFVAAGVLAYVLDPPTSRLHRLGMPRWVAALVMVLAAIAAVLLFALLLYPLILSQIGLFLGRIPQYVQLLQHWASHVVANLQQNFGTDVVNGKLQDLVSSQAGNMLTFLASALTGLITGGFALFNVLTLAVVTPVVAFYLLRDWPHMVAMIDGWLPRRYAAVTRAQAREVDRILSAWVRGQALCCVLLAVYYALALSLAGLDLGLIVGLAAGLLSFIPYVGSITGGVTAIALATAQFPSWRGVIGIAIVLIVGQILEGYVIYPRFLGDRVELPAVWVIFALFAGGAAFGFLGVMLAVPVAATIGVLCRFWLRRYMQSPLYLDPPPSGR
ncbi:MAG TPA: AI-2E family transporter [Acetobacteraceae bacterium]|nr:AI-2E family transporter [Acetobacteraceae bacterium]